MRERGDPSRGAQVDRLLLRGRLVLPDRVLADGVLQVEGSTITEVRPARPGDREVPGMVGRTVLPGLVDLHCHGGGGAFFADADPSRVMVAAAAHLRAGTTTLLASLVSAPQPLLEEQVARLAGASRAGTVAGVHLEGPWLSSAYRGAHDPRHLQLPGPEAARRLVQAGAGQLRMLTLAPELPGALDVVRALAEAGVIPAVGHTGATAEQTAAAFGAGARVTTHLFNGMAPFHHRAPGPVGAALRAAAEGSAVVELIGDGVHVDDEAVRLVFALLGPERIALVSDAVAAAGQPDGRYQLGGQAVEVRGGVARLYFGADPGPGEAAGTWETASLAGGTRFLLQVVARAVAAGVPLVAAVRAASDTPARVLAGGGPASVGALAVGRRADLVITDDALHPIAVLRGGAWAHGAPPQLPAPP